MIDWYSFSVGLFAGVYGLVVLYWVAETVATVRARRRQGLRRLLSSAAAEAGR